MSHPSHPRVAHHLVGAFGADTFGRRAEQFARFFGTPKFLIGQSVLVVGWIALNAWAVFARWDPYPFILLNLAFSLQAAYAAPLILLAQTRQADREKALSEGDAKHREVIARDMIALLSASTRQATQIQQLLEQNTALTEEVKQLTTDIHRHLISTG